MAAKKKILIIDDSAFMRRLLSDIINSDDRCVVVGVASDGKEGLEKIELLNPDVVTLDVQMPVMDGLTMLEILMKKRFVPVVLLSSLAKDGADITLRALDLGVVDFVCKPQNVFKVNTSEVRDEIIEKIIIASEITKITKLNKSVVASSTSKTEDAYDVGFSEKTLSEKAKIDDAIIREQTQKVREIVSSIQNGLAKDRRLTETKTQIPVSKDDNKLEVLSKKIEVPKVEIISDKPKDLELSKDNIDREKKELLEELINEQTKKETSLISIKEKLTEKNVLKQQIKKIVALGISTGGPKALQEVIPYIPKNIGVAVVIVQHMPAGFTKSLADRLNSLSELIVKEAEDGEVLKANYVYVAPGDYHLTFELKGKEYCLKLLTGPSVGGHKPSINVMMNTLSETSAKNVIAIIMTGMGSDGCEGMINLKKKNGAITIAQDEQTSVVYGMPKAVAEAGVVDRVLPLNEIAKEITKIVEGC